MGLKFSDIDILFANLKMLYTLEVDEFHVMEICRFNYILDFSLTI